MHPEDREFVRGIISRSLKEGIPVNVEYRIKADDGSSKWVLSRGLPVLDSNGRPFRLLGVTLDITEIKRMANGLEERLRFERLVAELSADFVNISFDEVDSEIESALGRLLS